MRRSLTSSLALAAILASALFLPDLIGDPGTSLAIFGFIGKAVGGIGKGIAKGVRGVGRIARGKIGKGLGDIAGAAGAVAPAVGLGPLGALLGVGSQLQGIAGAAGGPKILGIPLERLLDLGLGVGTAISSAKAAGKSNRILEAAIERERAEAAAREPFRKALLPLVENLGKSAGTPISLAEQFRDPTNPFAQLGAAPSLPGRTPEQPVQDAGISQDLPATERFKDRGRPSPEAERRGLLGLLGAAAQKTAAAARTGGAPQEAPSFMGRIARNLQGEIEAKKKKQPRGIAGLIGRARAA